jgi:hypothetical protein
VGIIQNETISYEAEAFRWNLAMRNEEPVAAT